MKEYHNAERKQNQAQRLHEPFPNSNWSPKSRYRWRILLAHLLTEIVRVPVPSCSMAVWVQRFRVHSEPKREASSCCLTSFRSFSLGSSESFRFVASIVF